VGADEMKIDSFTHSAGMAAQVFFLDLLLSGDNALVIALACRGLPRTLMARAVMLGTGLAILLRVILTTLASFLLGVPFLKLCGAVLLLVIAIKLLLADEHELPASLTASTEAGQLGSAVMMIVTADLVLSLDNVMALAAAAQGSVLFLIVGLLLSVPLLMYGNVFIACLLNDYPLLVPAGSALLGWIAGQIAVTDPLIADWVSTQSPALAVVVPLLCVAFVWGESRIIHRQRQRLSAPPPRLFRLATQQLARLGQADIPPAALHRVEESLAPAASLEAAPSMTAFAPPPLAEAAPEEPWQRDRVEAALLKLLIWLAVGIGAVSIGWILLHLLSHGLMPAPEHPAKLAPLPK